MIILLSMLSSSAGDKAPEDFFKSQGLNIKQGGRKPL
jgi:hypothetical protein